MTYTPRDVVAGDPVSLMCNTSDGNMWTYVTRDGLVDYVYWNGRVDNDRPWLSVNTSEDDLQTLTISRVQVNDSGLYDCYNSSGLRSVGYQLNGACVTLHYRYMYF